MLACCSNPECDNDFESGPVRLRAIKIQNSTAYMVVWMCDDCSRDLSMQQHRLFSPLAVAQNTASTMAWA